MKIVSVLLFLVLIFCGCSKSAWETLNDSDQPMVVSTKAKHTHKIDVNLPDELSLFADTNGCSLYTDDSGDFEVETRTFLASSMEAALETLTGFQADELSVLKTEKDNVIYYRLSWITNGEKGECIHTAKLMLSGPECYAVVCTTNENSSYKYKDQIRQVMATCELVSDDLV